MRVFVPFALGLCLLGGASAQNPENLQTILDRGHVRQWFVAGPFAPDVPGGVAEAIRTGRPRLGETDYLASIGGIRRARPQDGLSVPVEGGEGATWRTALRTGPMLDLSPLLGDRSEGVVYAAFYVIADRAGSVLLEVESTLGARVAHNGGVVRDISNVPAADLNTQWIVLQLRAGVNVFVFELPAAALSRVAEASGIAPEALSDAIRRSRPMLVGESGAELGVRVHPVEQAGSLYVIPELRPTGSYTGSVTEPRKEVALRVYNADTRTSQPVTATVTRLRGSVGLRRSLAAVPPGKVASLLFEVPLGGATPGSLETVLVQVAHAASAIQFRTALMVEPPPTAGTVAYVLRPAADAASDYLETYRAHALLAAAEEEFGFNLGPGYLWRAGWARYPEVRESVQRAVIQGRIAAASGYAQPDARLVNATVEMRNLQLGRAMSEAYLADWEPVYVSWDQPALPWRFADLYAAAGGEGVIDNLPYRGRDALGMLAGPGGTSLPVRHKKEVVRAVSKPQLRDTARLHRQETSEAGLRADVLVGEYAGLPEPFWADDAVSLSRSVPSVMVTGAGGRVWVESMPLAEAGGYLPPVAMAPAWLSIRPGELVAQPAIKAAHARVMEQLEQAETFATLAGIAGASFPDAALDAAWREVLWASDADRLGYADNFGAFAETLQAYRRAADHARTVKAESLETLARYADTYTDAPAQDETVHAVVVFNGASFPRTDRVEADLDFNQFAGFRLIDDAGRDVAYVADEVFLRNERISRMRFSFVARNVPAFGYKTYYVVARSRPIVWGDADGHRIENDWFELTVDPGRGGMIASLKWKETGQEFAPNGLNDVITRTQDALNTQGGREIWGDDGAGRASAVEATVRKRIGPAMQRLEIASPFGGGRLVRTLTLYEGLDRVYCTLRLEGVRRDAGLIGIEFPAADAHPQALVGDGLGVRVARVSAADAPFETQGMDHRGRAWEPASGMFYLGPGDAIRGAQDTGYPLRPARIVLADEAFEDAADALVRAFASIGVPADLFDVRPRDRGVYTDAAPWADVADAQRMGEVMWVVLGDPQIAALGLPDAPEGSLRFFAQGVGQLGGPVLGVYGGDAERVETAANEMADALTQTGALALAPEAIVDAVELPNLGFAVLMRGNGLVSFDRDRATWFIAHRDTLSGASAAGWDSDTRTVAVEYAIAPVAGDWRTRSVPQQAAAHASPLAAHVTDLHLGAGAQEHSFLTVSGAGVIASGLRPSSMKMAAGALGETHPRDGVVFALAETYGRRRTAAIRAGGLGFDAGVMNAAGMVIEEFRIERGAFDVDLAANAVELAGYRPAILRTIPSVPETGPVTRVEWSRPWEHGRAAMPEGGLPVTLAFREPPATEQSSVMLVIANNRSDAPVSGTVRLEASDGWAVGTDAIAYDIAPGEWQEETVLLLRGHRPDTGFVLASTAVGGAEVIDVWPRTGRYHAVAERRGDEVQVKIENQSATPLIGSVALVCESSEWPELGARPGIAPQEYTVRVNPYETRRTLFTLPGGDWRGPIMAKVAVNGGVAYLAVVE